MSLLRKYVGLPREEHWGTLLVLAVVFGLAVVGFGWLFNTIVETEGFGPHGSVMFTGTFALLSSLGVLFCLLEVVVTLAKAPKKKSAKTVAKVDPVAKAAPKTNEAKVAASATSTPAPTPPTA